MRIGPKSVVDGYTKLTNKFGFFGNQEQVSLIIPNKERYDAIINTATGDDPATLAKELLNKLSLKVEQEQVITSVNKF